MGAVEEQSLRLRWRQRSLAEAELAGELRRQFPRLSLNAGFFVTPKSIKSQ